MGNALIRIVLGMAVGCVLAAEPNRHGQRIDQNYGCNGREAAYCRDHCEANLQPGEYLDGTLCFRWDQLTFSAPACSSPREPIVWRQGDTTFINPVTPDLDRARVCNPLPRPMSFECYCKAIDCRTDWGSGIPWHDPRCPVSA